jgi:exopolysaccharide biosynthesis polyprenyl glycosylphosphotransferase
MIPRRLFVVMDACLVVGTFVITYALFPWLEPVRSSLARLAVSFGVLNTVSPETGYMPPLAERLWMLLIIAPAVLLTLLAIDAYGRLDRISRTRIALAGPLASFMGLSLATLVIFLLKINQWSRFFLFAFTVLTAVALTGVRLFIRTYHKWKAKAGSYRRNLLLVAADQTLTRLLPFVQSHWTEEEVSVIGYLSPPESISLRSLGVFGSPLLKNARPAPDRFGMPATAVTDAAADDSGDLVRGALSLRCLGNAIDIETVLLRHPVHEVVLFTDAGSAEWMSEVVRTCDSVGVPLRLVPDVLLSCRLNNLVIVEDRRHERKAPAILLAPPVWGSEGVHVKRLIDLFVSLVALIFLAPLFGFIALLIRLSGPGQIFHRYYMVGQNGKPFLGQKFRTMVPNANVLKASLLERNEMTGPVFKMTNDPRVTRVGRWLRKYSLDELPQLYSVVKGDMSLVGPRPSGPDEFERYEFWHMRKVSVKPGITCLWQVRGRNAISNFDEWVRMDLEYIDHWSLWLDLKILARTLMVVAKGTGR